MDDASLVATESPEWPCLRLVQLQFAIVLPSLTRFWLFDLGRQLSKGNLTTMQARSSEWSSRCITRTCPKPTAHAKTSVAMVSRTHACVCQAAAMPSEWASDGLDSNSRQAQQTNPWDQQQQTGPGTGSGSVTSSARGSAPTHTNTAPTGRPSLFRAIPWGVVWTFLADCFQVLTKMSAPTIQDAVNRLALILATTFVMIVVVTTIDSSYLWVYVQNARRLA